MVGHMGACASPPRSPSAMLVAPHVRCGCAESGAGAAHHGPQDVSMCEISCSESVSSGCVARYFATVLAPAPQSGRRCLKQGEQAPLQRTRSRKWNAEGEK